MSNLAAVQSSKIKGVHFDFGDMFLFFKLFISVLKFGGIIGWIETDGNIVVILKVWSKLLLKFPHKCDKLNHQFTWRSKITSQRILRKLKPQVHSDFTESQDDCDTSKKWQVSIQVLECFGATFQRRRPGWREQPAKRRQGERRCLLDTKARSPGSVSTSVTHFIPCGIKDRLCRGQRHISRHKQWHLGPARLS